MEQSQKISHRYTIYNMEITKITNNSFNLYKEADYYVLALGAITRQTNRETELKITGIDTATKEVKAKCGCTTTNQTIVDENTMTISVKYNECERQFSKVVEIKDKNQKVILKIQGTCNSL